MATNPSNNPTTGGKALAANTAGAAASLAGPALQLASGAGVLRTAADTIKGAALDKLLGPMGLFAGISVGVLRTMKAIVDQTGILERGMKRIASLQQIQGKFETLLKSAEAAEKRLKELFKFTAKSPFDFREVAEGNRVLEALTKGALSGAKGMKMVGDSAAATGESFSTTAERVGKLYNALRSGRSLDKVMFQLQFTGLVTDDLARKLETLEQSGAGFEEMWAAVEAQMNRTAGGMANEMKNLDALTQRLDTANKMFEKAFAAPFVDAQAKAMENTIKATENLVPLIGKIGADLAPIFQWTSLIKGKLYDWIFATKGFADALTSAYGVARAFAVALGGGILASMAATLVTAAQAATAFTSSLLTTARAAALTTTAQAAAAATAALHAEAATAAASGNLLSAAALKAQAYWSAVSAAATRLHTVALATATTTARGFNIVTYLSALAVGTLNGALALMGRAIATMSRGMVAFAAANPLVAIGAAAATAALAFHSWANAIQRANKEYVDLANNSAKATRALREEIEAVRNLDQYRAALAKTDKEEKDVTDAIRELGPAPSKTVQTAIGPGGGAFEVSNPAYEEFRDTKQVLEDRLKSIRAGRDRLRKRDVNTLGLSSEEESKLVDNAEKESRLRDQREQAEIDKADDVQREKLLRARAARLAGEADEGQRTEEGRLRKEKFQNNPTELMQVAKQIETLEKAKQNVPPALLQKRADLAANAGNYQEKRGQAIQDNAEADRIRDALRMKKIELEYDRLIAETRSKGGETAAVEAGKELSILREQLRVAEAKGEAGKFDADQARARIKIVEADRAKFRSDAGVDRAKNNALINGDPKAAQVLDDVVERQKMRDRYRANGLSVGQADKDFASSILAQAAQTQPRIVADSMQRIGGGGGATGSSPILAATQRLEKIQTAQVKLLEIIAGNSEEGGTLK